MGNEFISSHEGIVMNSEDYLNSKQALKKQLRFFMRFAMVWDLQGAKLMLSIRMRLWMLVWW